MSDRDTNLPKKVKERDDYICLKCNRNTESKGSLVAHHIVPLSWDGEDSMENMATLCNHCDTYVPENALDAEWYEEAFEDYIATDVRPEIDLARFGDEIDIPIEQLQVAYNAVLESRRTFDGEKEWTQPEYYWIILATVAGHGVFPEATGIDPLADRLNEPTGKVNARITEWVEQ